MRIKKIGLIILACVLLLSLTNCDFRLKTKWEVEEYLEKRYGREFAVLSSGSVIEDYYDDHVWRVRLYREPIWPKDQSCFIRIGSNELSTKIDTSAEAIEEYILSKASWYEEKYIQVQ